jgi:hypothetical protein
MPKLAIRLRKETTVIRKLLFAELAVTPIGCAAAFSSVVPAIIPYTH